MKTEHLVRLWEGLKITAHLKYYWKFVEKVKTSQNTTKEVREQNRLKNSQCCFCMLIVSCRTET